MYNNEIILNKTVTNGYSVFCGTYLLSVGESISHPLVELRTPVL